MRQEERACWYATGVFAVTAIAALAVPALRSPAAVVAGLLWLLGAGAMVTTLVIGARRSRYEAVDVFGLFFTQAPMRMRAGALVIQTVIALATASVRPNTSAAFGILAPLSALGLCGLWSARHGNFPARKA